MNYSDRQGRNIWGWTLKVASDFYRQVEEEKNIKKMVASKQRRGNREVHETFGRPWELGSISIGQHRTELLCVEGRVAESLVRAGESRATLHLCCEYGRSPIWPVAKTDKSDKLNSWAQCFQNTFHHRASFPWDTMNKSIKYVWEILPVTFTLLLEIRKHIRIFVVKLKFVYSSISPKHILFLHNAY